MKVNLYVLFDVVAQESSHVQQLKNDGIALRWYQDALKKTPRSDDIVLYRIGKYDTETMAGIIFDHPDEVVPNVNMETSDE